MDPINRLAVTASLETQSCGLRHEKLLITAPAEDCIVLDIGRDDGIVKEICYQLTIPVCKECLDSIVDGRWLLLYCGDCDKSNWVDRWSPKYQNQYGDNYNLVVLLGCPDCTNQSRGTYFINIEQEGVSTLVVN